MSDQQMEHVMKQFISKVKNLSQKAAEIQAAMQQVPPKVAEIREAVAATTGQLQQLKAEIQFSVADLKADDEQRLTAALQEINANAEVLGKAGFVLSGVDLEISPVQRMLVHLARVEGVHPSVIRSLLSASKQQRTTHAILSSLLQAQQMAAAVKLDELDYAEVAVGIGPVPSVRLCWRAETAEAPTAAGPVQTMPVPPPITALAPMPLPAFSQSSFFEKRPPQPAPTVQQTVVPTSLVSTPLPGRAEKSSVMETALTSSPEAKVDPLARFKRMPDLTKLKR